MPSYTAILFLDPDGTYVVRVPALPSSRHVTGLTRSEALANAKAAIVETLDEMARQGRKAPREEWSPARTVWVQDPRQGESIPYLIAVERADDDRFTATPAVFPDLQETASTIDEALTNIGSLIYQHLVGLVAEKRLYPTQDDQQSYIVRVPRRTT